MAFLAPSPGCPVSGTATRTLSSRVPHIGSCIRPGSMRTRPPSASKCHATASTDVDEAQQSPEMTRRSTIAALTSTLLLPSASPALALREGAPVEIDPISAFTLEDFTPTAGWTELDSGLLYKVIKKGEGDRAKGIFDKVDHFQPFPFVTVKYTAYEPSGKVVASSLAGRRDHNYQAGVRQEMQDEDGAVMSMVVGERRQFVVPLDLAYKRKLFGQIVPQREALLVDVELLFLQPY